MSRRIKRSIITSDSERYRTGAGQRTKLNYKTKGEITKCPDKSVRDYMGCKEVTEWYRMFEKRSACMWHYLINQVKSSRTDVFSNMLTVPIIASFIDDEDEREKWIFNAAHVMYSENRQVRIRDSWDSIMTHLTKCNIEWNKKMPEKQYYYIKKYLRPQFTFAQDWSYPVTYAITFLREIQGVIGKDDFVDRSAYYFDSVKGKVVKQADYIKLCSGRKSDCEQDSKCAYRLTSRGNKACAQKTRIRAIRPNDPTSYYILEDDGEPKFIYFPLCVYKIINLCGVFRKKEIKGDGKLKTRDTYICTFPPFGEPDVGRGSGRKYTRQKPSEKALRKSVGSLTFYQNAFYVFYYNAYVGDVTTYDGERVGVHQGMYKYMRQWYKKCIVPSNIPKNADIELVGISLGGALTNVAAFVLINAGYTNVHMFALGAPRAGDKKFKKWMEGQIGKTLKRDSANYVRFNNIVRTVGKGNDEALEFYTEFDPVTKSPPNTWSTLGSVSSVPVVGSYMGYHLRWSDNPRIRIMGGPFVFNPVFKTFNTQGDYNALPVGKQTPFPVDGNCYHYYSFIHSMAAYSENCFQGSLYNSPAVIGGNPKYYEYFNQIMDLDKKIIIAADNPDTGKEELTTVVGCGQPFDAENNAYFGGYGLHLTGAGAGTAASGGGVYYTGAAKTGTAIGGSAGSTYTGIRGTQISERY